MHISWQSRIQSIPVSRIQSMPDFSETNGFCTSFFQSKKKREVKLKLTLAHSDRPLLTLTAPNLAFIFTKIKYGTQIREVLAPPPPQKSGIFFYM